LSSKIEIGILQKIQLNCSAVLHPIIFLSDIKSRTATFILLINSLSLILEAPIFFYQPRKKYGWIGHTLRKSQNEICHSVLEWNPQGRRSRGRPKATWRRTVLAECELKPETAIDGS
jgi:hypothetical protein